MMSIRKEILSINSEALRDHVTRFLDTSEVFGFGEDYISSFEIKLETFTELAYITYKVKGLYYLVILEHDFEKVITIHIEGSKIKGWPSNEVIIHGGETCYYSIIIFKFIVSEDRVNPLQLVQQGQLKLLTVGGNEDV